MNIIGLYGKKQFEKKILFSMSKSTSSVQKRKNPNVKNDEKKNDAEKENEKDDKKEQKSSAMNPANLLTISRLPLLFVCVLFLYYPTRWGATFACVVYAIASITDWLDGYVARRWRFKSDLGAFMDALMDKIFTLGVFTSLLVLEILPRHALFAVLVIISREFTITGLRTVAASKNIVIPAQGEGKIKTAMQMISTTCLLVWFALKRDFYYKYTLEDIMWIYYLGYIMFLLATVLTFVSGLIYLIRFRFVM